MFNLLSIMHQLYLNNYSRSKLTLEALKKMPKKEGWLQKKMREAQEISGAKGGASLPSKSSAQSDVNKQTKPKNKPKSGKKKK